MHAMARLLALNSVGKVTSWNNVVNPNNINPNSAKKNNGVKPNDANSNPPIIINPENLAPKLVTGMMVERILIGKYA